MIYSLLLLAAAPQTGLPQPLTPTHMRDIACVAVIGLVARDQREARPQGTRFPDVQVNGKKWAGIVGNRVTEETGQPREIIAAEIQAAVERELRVTAAPDVTNEMRVARVRDCTNLMNAELLSLPLPKPVKPVVAK